MIVFIERTRQTRTPDLFEVPYLRPSDSSPRILLSAEKIASLCSVRVLKDYKDDRFRTVYFDASDQKGGTYPLASFSARTPTEADAIVDGVLKAMRNWTSFGPVTVAVDGFRRQG